MYNYKKIIIILLLFVIATFAVIYLSVQSNVSTESKACNAPFPTSVKLNLNESQFQKIINNPALSLDLTLITQNPPRIVQKQTDNNIEAIIITLQGKGQIRIHGGEFNNKILPISESEIAYCPPKTDFSIINIRKKQILKYLYIRINIQ